MKQIKNLVYNKWLSDIIGNRSYTLKLDKEFIARCKEYGTDKNNWLHSIKKNNTEPLFIYSKVSTQAIEQIQYLESIEFFLIDTNLTMKKEIKSQYIKNKKQEAHEKEIRFANGHDREGAVSVALNTFIYSRFHLDPRFSNIIANKIKSQWVSSYFDGTRGEQMVVALINDKIIGFLLILKPTNNYIIIDLIAVNKDQQRKGIAKKMINFAIQENNGINKVLVGTQIGNIPSIKLYQQMGFIFHKAKYVFHLYNT